MEPETKSLNPHELKNNNNSQKEKEEEEATQQSMLKDWVLAGIKDVAEAEAADASIAIAVAVLAAVADVVYVM